MGVFQVMLASYLYFHFPFEHANQIQTSERRSFPKTKTDVKPTPALFDWLQVHLYTISLMNL